MAKAVRDLATQVSRLQPQALTRTNGEEADHGPGKDPKSGSRYPANFTKGLLHDIFGLVKHAEDYRCFVEAINAPDPTLFEKQVEGADEKKGFKFHSVLRGTKKKPKWRGWESPRAGHVYELEGPDAGAVGMAPAPRVGSSELAAEMAEVYAMAILRDVPFTVICEGGSRTVCKSGGKFRDSLLSAAEVAKLLGGMRFYSGDCIRSSTPSNTGDDNLNRFERNRRKARCRGKTLRPEILFRGSTEGAFTGPYISQFMLIGNKSRAGAGGTNPPNHPGTSATYDVLDGLVNYGSIVIDQRTLSQKNCLDYMTDWCSWLDVQNGAALQRTDVFEKDRRFITTPRDLATYVHFDALYEAYLNACLILIDLETPSSRGFPEPGPSGHRTPFATFGGPHILSLVCEVATRCLKAVRRQKFNYHRRCRPETIGGRFHLVDIKEGGKLGCAEDDFQLNLSEIPDQLLEAVRKHNKGQNSKAMRAMRNFTCGADDKDIPKKLNKADNLLLPMAFPEGSPMHPAYGAGHATVAGGCVTMLKAFFEMYEDCDARVERPLYGPKGLAYVPTADGACLKKAKPFEGRLTIQGELDKLAANISIGRNMAGVHYYSDYYDSLRMGERIAVGILMEQAPTYGDAIECTFKSFDGDLITITGEAGSCPSLSILGPDGTPVQPDEWWLRHVSGREMSEDF
ncbi:MAG: vanadium-dependent haloperoxidase [Planctomycetota bacterium]